MAAAPVTVGAAPDVPPKVVSPAPVPTSADTHAPGAPRSGFTADATCDGPREDVDTIVRSRSRNMAGSIVTVTGAGAVSSSRPSAWLTTRAGMTGTHSAAVPHENPAGSPARCSPRARRTRRR